MSPKRPNTPLRAISSGNFDLILKRLTRPSAEEEMRAAFAKLEEGMASGKLLIATAKEKEARERQTEKERRRLEKRLELLVELKEIPAPKLATWTLLALLFVAAIISAVVGIGLEVGKAIAQEASEAAVDTTFRVDEMRTGFRVGQYVGVAEWADFDDAKTGMLADERWRVPTEYIELIAIKYAEDCDLRNEFIVENVDCKESARLDFVLRENEDITMTCLLAVPEPGRPLVGPIRPSFINQESRAIPSRQFFLGESEDSSDPATLMACQTYGTENIKLSSQMIFAAGQTALRHNTSTHDRAYIHYWFEADGSRAPKS